MTLYMYLKKMLLSRIDMHEERVIEGISVTVLKDETVGCK